MIMRLIYIENGNDDVLPIGQGQMKLKKSCNKKVSNFVNDGTNNEDSLSCDLFVDDQDIYSSIVNNCDICNTCKDWRKKAAKEF